MIRRIAVLFSCLLAASTACGGKQDDTRATASPTSSTVPTTVSAPPTTDGDHDPTLTDEDLAAIDYSVLDDIDLDLACDDAAVLLLIGSGMSDIESTNFEGEITMRGLTLPSDFHAELTTWATLVASFYPGGDFDADRFESVHSSDEFWSFQHRVSGFIDANCDDELS